MGDSWFGAADFGVTGSVAVNPIELQKALAGLTYPASRHDIQAAADRNGAASRLKQALARLDEEQFESPLEVNRAITDSSKSKTG